MKKSNIGAIIRKEFNRFFTDRLIEAGVDPETAERDACRMEHVISQESFEKIRAHVREMNEHL